ncbi:MAG: 2-dehydropantoate 2-reductase [Gracilibacteraceae bacterium]|jgi:2-dehydropantoate 2-reductase|nr:2-dehydropantoate 2-reductase [Gracilibacteraceae bacterium]
MQYLIIGAGGTGGSLAAYLARGGRAVTLIARGKHLEAIRSGGLRVETPHLGNFTLPLPVFAQDEYTGRPDVVLQCVKGYSVAETIPFIRRVAGADTVVIPILNIFGTGGRMQAELPGVPVMDGCMYVTASIEAPGTVKMHDKLMRVIFGPRRPEESHPALSAIAAEMKDCGITTVLSKNIRHDTLRKFSFISALAACGLYYDATAAQIRTGEKREMFIGLVREMEAVATAMGIPFQVDILQVNLTVLDGLAPDMLTSLQRDEAQGHPSEIDGLLFEPLRMGAAVGVDMPLYARIAARFNYKTP